VLVDRLGGLANRGGRIGLSGESREQSSKAVGRPGRKRVAVRELAEPRDRFP